MTPLSRRRNVCDNDPGAAHKGSGALTGESIMETFLTSSSLRKILLLTAVTLALMLLFPPFHQVLPNGVVRNLGYEFLFNPPKGVAGREGVINIPLLLTQAGLVICLSAIAVLLSYIESARRHIEKSDQK